MHKAEIFIDIKIKTDFTSNENKNLLRILLWKTLKQKLMVTKTNI